LDKLLGHLPNLSKRVLTYYKPGHLNFFSFLIAVLAPKYQEVAILTS